MVGRMVSDVIQQAMWQDKRMHGSSMWSLLLLHLPKPEARSPIVSGMIVFRKPKLDP